MKEHFGTTVDGVEVDAYTLDNGYLSAKVISYGATLVGVCAPDKDGVRKDVVLGYDELRPYEVNGGCLGATVAPVCNRTRDAEMVIDGETYHLVKNCGEHNCHTDKKAALFRRPWDAVYDENSVTFTISLKDGELGLPGERQFAATYSLTEHGVLLHYHATSDKTTALNVTNHVYFNLDGHDAGQIEDTLLMINASHITETDAESIPDGVLYDVTGTTFDFRTEKAIGRDIADDNEMLQWAGGYDHNYCLDGYTGGGEMLHAATARDPKSGRVLEVYTTLPGVQFYTGNGLGTKESKGGSGYGRRDGFCLETQYYPDTIHHENFPSYLFGKGESYDAQTKFRFYAEGLH